MKFIWGSVVVPTNYAVYLLADKESGVLKFVEEFETKGHALQWIAKSGEKDKTYCIRTQYRRR